MRESQICVDACMKACASVLLHCLVDMLTLHLLVLLACIAGVA